MSEWYGEDVFERTPLRQDSHLPSIARVSSEPLKPRKLTFEEASRCLNTLGKDESGVRYAYLMLTATEKKLSDVTVILSFKHLLYLDLSGNLLNLASLQVLCDLPFLLYLKAERNVVESASLQPMPYLQVLILNKNQISETSDISQQMLETLEMGDNSLYTPQFQKAQLEYLKNLSLHGNFLIDTSGSYPFNLETLYLNRNKVMKITPDVCDLKYLQVLHLRENLIKKLNGFTTGLENLTYLNLRSNKIEKLREFRKLQCLPKLETLIVLENPIYKTISKEDMEEEEEEYHDDISEDDNEEKRIRLALLVLLPKLKRINKIKVTEQEKEEAMARGRQIIKEIFEEESSEDEVEITLTTTDFTTEYTTETSVEMKGTPLESNFKLENFISDEEGEAHSGRRLEKRVDINLIPEVESG